MDNAATENTTAQTQQAEQPEQPAQQQQAQQTAQSTPSPPAPEAAPTIAESVREAVPAPQTSGIEDCIKRIGGLRDGVLTGAGVVYLCGYGVWSFNAWRNNLGLLPALQYQYFVAGLSFLLMIGLLAFVFYLGLCADVCAIKVSLWLSRVLFTRLQTRWVRVLASSSIPMFVLACFTWAISRLATPLLQPLLTFPASKSVIQAVGLYLSICYMSGVTVALDADHKTFVVPKWPSLPRKRINIVTVAHTVLGGVVWTLISTVLTAYFVSGYSSIPQEFGGVKPRIARIDIKRAELSEEMRSALLPIKVRKLPADKTKDPYAVVQSMQVDVYFAGTDFYLVRPHGTAVETPVYQLKKEVVQNVKWLGYSLPAKSTKQVEQVKPRTSPALASLPAPALPPN